MGEWRIGASLDSAPAMLRSIILETLGATDGVTVVAIPPGRHAATCQAMVLVDDDAPHEHLRGRVRVAINFDSRTAHAIVSRKGQIDRMIDEFSVDTLAAILRSVGWKAARPGATRWYPRGWFARMEGQSIGPEPRLIPPRVEPANETTATLPLLHLVPVTAPADAHVDDGDPVSAELARIAARLAETLMPAINPPAGLPPPELRDLIQALAAAQSARRPTPLAGLDRAAALFGLSPDERDLLFMAGVVEIDPRAARLVALLNGHPSRFRPTVGLVERWRGDVRGTIERLSVDGPLQRYGLVTIDGDGPIATRQIIAAPDYWPALFGMKRTPAFRVERHAEPPQGLPGVIAETDQLEALDDAVGRLAARRDKRLLVAVAGDEDTGRGAIAAAIARRCAEARLVVAGPALADPAAQAALERDAMLANACIILTQPETVPEPVWKALNARFAGLLIVTCRADEVGRLAMAAERAVVRFDAPDRDAAQRARLWAALAPGGWSSDEITAIADRFDFGERRIGAALANAALQSEAEGDRDLSPGQVQQACAALRDAAFEGSAELIETRYRPDEIVLREETRRELDMVLAWARHGSRLFGKSGDGAALHAGGGLACLFSGPPGTGKTMAAQVVATEIDYSLYRVDLSHVVDKYIGEGEKRISKLFREAARSRVALFFDEADALFGKRSDVKSSNDRYANIAVNHLLQELEGFDGLAILATNFAANIDPAFTRRIRVKADFVAPDFKQRLEIWQRMLPAAVRADSDLDLEWLAREYELVGGEIRNAIYAAHLLAAEDGHDTRLAMRHCIAGLAREIDKTGRVVESFRLRAPHADRHPRLNVVGDERS